MKLRTNIIAGILILLVSGIVSAIELDLSGIGSPIETVDMHGFFGQGYMKSSKNDIYGDTRDGTMDLRDFGVNFSGYLTDDIMLAAQVIGYSLGGQGGDVINLHYGLLDYRLSDAIGFRVGRIRTPNGLYNEYRDIDMLRTSIFLPTSIYPEIYRDYTAGTDAVAIYGNVEFGYLGRLNYQAFAGKPNISSDERADLAYLFKGLGLKNEGVSDASNYGMQFIVESPLNIDGLRGGLTWRKTDLTFHNSFGGFDLPLNEVMHYTQYVWSAEYQVDKLTVAGEYAYERNSGAPAATSWYAGGSYALTEKLSLGGNYSKYSQEGAAGDTIDGHQNTVSLYGKYSITDNWLVKAQVDLNRGTARNHNINKTADDELESTLFSVKTSWSF